MSEAYQTLQTEFAVDMTCQSVSLVCTGSGIKELIKQCVNAVGDALKDLPGEYKLLIGSRSHLTLRHRTLRH